MRQIIADIQIEMVKRNDDSATGIFKHDRAGIRSDNAPTSQPLRMVFRLSLILLIALAIPLTAFATSIVATWTPEEIIIAADSKVSEEDSCRTIKSVCKIEPIGAKFAAYAGPVQKSIEGRDIVRAAARPPGTLRDTAVRFEALITDALNAVLKLPEIEREIPTTVTKEWIDQQIGTLSASILIFGIENGQIVLLKRTVQARVGPGGRVEFAGERNQRDYLDCPGATCIAWVPIGRTNAIVAREVATPGFSARFPPWQVAIEWVRTEIESREDNCWVGGPIDVLRLTKDRTCWIQCKPECQQGIPDCPNDNVTSAMRRILHPEPPLAPAPPR